LVVSNLNSWLAVAVEAVVVAHVAAEAVAGLHVAVAEEAPHGPVEAFRPRQELLARPAPALGHQHVRPRRLRALDRVQGAPRLPPGLQLHRQEPDQALARRLRAPQPHSVRQLAARQLRSVLQPAESLPVLAQHRVS